MSRWYNCFMSGHSKWSQIKRKKGLTDQKRGQIFSKMSRLITLSVKEGGGITDPEKNVKLRLAVTRAKSENMPKENIDRAISKASGGESGSVQEVLYEGFGPSGVSLVITGVTDNANRTHSEVKNLLEKNGGKIGTVGSVAYLFDKCGLIAFDKETTAEEAVFSFADKINAIDIESTGDSYIVYIPFDKLGLVPTFTSGLEPTLVEPYYRPKSPILVPDKTKNS